MQTADIIPQPFPEPSALVYRKLNPPPELPSQKEISTQMNVQHAANLNERLDLPA